MEHLTQNEPQEIVLTYRQKREPEVVELRYEQPLPRRMCPEDPFDHAVEVEKALLTKKKRNGRVIAGLCLLALLVGVGTGIFFLQQSRGASSPQNDQQSQQGVGQGAEQIPDLFGIETSDDREEPHINTYRPMGGSKVELALVKVEDDRQALSADQIYDKLRTTVVTVIGYKETTYGISTGIIFHSDGYILTNYHAVAGCNSCEVWVTDEYGVEESYEALFVGGDADQDLAVLKIEGENLSAAEFGVSDDLTVGDKVYAIGNPLGLELRGTFTDGIVSAVNRDMEMDGVIMTLIQTNTALNIGNSGGPLINQYGQVVGINTIKMKSSYETIEGLGFAIPTSFAVRWINDIIAVGEILPGPVLGLMVNRIPVPLPDGSMGLEVAEVTPGLTGDKAGVKVGDCVVAFAGEEVKTTDEILALRRTLCVGDRVVIRICRDGEYMDLTMAMMPEE